MGDFTIETMSQTTRTSVELRLNHARILWTHWQRDDAIDGYVREFSPDAGHVRISGSPRESDKGVWYRAADLRCVEVLEQNFDFKAWNLKEQKRRTREREGDIGGEGWKYGDNGGDD